MESQLRRMSCGWRYPAMAAVTVVCVVLILCSSSNSQQADAQGVHQWSTDKGIAALRNPNADREQKRRALVALHRNARAAISALEWTTEDPTIRDEAVRLLADIERELAKVEHR